jgi:hypothetical protein
MRAEGTVASKEDMVRKSLLFSILGLLKICRQCVSIQTNQRLIV